MSPHAIAPAGGVASSTAEGLSSGEAARRLSAAGSNAIVGQSGHPLALLAAQFRSPLILILVAAALLSFALGEAGEALVIGAIVLASSMLGFVQEYRAANAMAALATRLSVTANVLRDGRLVSIPTGEVVPGDVVELVAGSLVPADGVLIEAVDLQVDEAALTGESFPVAKTAGSTPQDDTSCVHMGTSVRSGRARMLVQLTGQQTQFGALAASLGKLEPETGFARGVRRFGLLMTQIMLVMITLILPVNLLLGRPLLESLLFAAALAVGLTPELLPAVISVTLSRGAQTLAGAGVLVRRLVAIENLGAMDILCTDKTGTITRGIVQLDRATDAHGIRSAETLRLAAINASLQGGMPNALDDAIVAAGASLARDHHQVDELGYDFERQRLSVLAEGPDGRVLICKGAVPSVLAVSTRVRSEAGVAGLSADAKAIEDRRLAAWAAEGYRVLAVATKPMGDRPHVSAADEQDLVLEGYLLFSDPLKPDAARVIADLGRIGVRLKMITGDNRHVARHVAAAAGITADAVLTGEDVRRLTDRALARRAPGVDVFAEITPDQKERIVTALRQRDKVVGYLGDGINDAPALRAADLGISIDTALDAARDAADVVLLEHDLGVLKDGILIGRTAFANTLKYIAITTSANLGNMISMALASLALPFLPMLAKQILLNNALSDLPMMAISTDRVSPEVLERPGRWNFPELLRSMLVFGLLSSLFDALTFAFLLFVVRAQEATFQTSWFLVSLLTELVIIIVMRTRGSILTDRPGRFLVSIGLLVTIFAVALPYLPFAGALGLVPLPLEVQASLFGIVLAYGVVSEVVKRQAGSWLHRPSSPLGRRQATDRKRPGV